MNYRDQVRLYDDHKKWSEWNLRSAKPQAAPQRKLTNYASAFVFAMSGLVVSGFHLNLTI